MKNNKLMRGLLIVGIGVSALFFLVPTLSFGVDYYVSPTGSGGNGSKGSPWGPSEIPWANWESGSTDVYLYFFGGTYSNTLITRHNYEGNRVYIKPGSASPSPSGISGQVIFARTNGGNMYLYSGANVSHNLTIDGETTAGSGTRNIKVVPGNGHGIEFSDSTSQRGVILRYLEITGLYDSDPGQQPPNYPSSIYAIYAYNVGVGTEIDTCYFNNNDFASSDQMIFLENTSVTECGGVACPSQYIRIENNTFQDTGLVNGLYYSNPILIKNNATNSFISDVIITGNTFVKNGYMTRMTSSAGSGKTFNLTNYKVTNNIAYDVSNAVIHDTANITLVYTAESHAVLDYNMLYRVAGGFSFNWVSGVGGPNKTYTSLSTFAADHPAYTHNLNANPLLVSSTDFRLQGSSPAINVGYDASAYTNMDGSSLWPKDKDGVTRPVGGAWDIGAYEYGEDTTPPVISNALPSGVQQCDAESPVDIALSVTTNENATCKYDTVDTTYDLMANTYTTTGTTTHS